MQAKYVLFALSLLSSFSFFSQTKKVLFLGNSYTGVNNLPLMVSKLALSAGDTLVYDSNTPGGSTLQQHTSNASSMSKIKQGAWDFVVLQEQSQLPSFPIGQVASQCFPFAKALNDSILQYNPCAETIFYMTWGRKNGDAGNCSSWPPVCTYEGMDSLLHLRYKMMADSNQAIISAVGAAWNYVRTNFPGIELYQSDESHPSLAGSYLAACVFYSTIFRKSPLQIADNYGLNASDALLLRNAAKTVVFEHLENWFIGRYDVKAQFVANPSGSTQFSFSNTSLNSNSFTWNFGDGTSSNDENPSHTFSTTGTFQVQLIASTACDSDTSTQIIQVQTSGIQAYSLLTEFSVYPNPTEGMIEFQLLPSSNFQLLDVLGNKITVPVRVQENKGSIDLSQQKAGVYFLQVNSKNQSRSLRIVKK